MYTGILYILLKRLMPLKFCNQTKSKALKKCKEERRLFLMFYNIRLSVHTYIWLACLAELVKFKISLWLHVELSLSA